MKKRIVILLVVVILVLGVMFVYQNIELKMLKEKVNNSNQQINEQALETNSKIEYVHDENTSFKEVSDENKEVVIKENDDEIKKITIEENKLRPSYFKDFFTITEDSEDYFVYSIDGDMYGWEEGLWGGCSTWCSVMNFYSNEVASSTLNSHGNFSYIVSNIGNHERKNAWVEGVEGSGIGEYIDITQMCQVGNKNYKTDIAFKELCIVNGYAATNQSWKENNRIKELKLYFNGKYIKNIILADTMNQQYIDISSLNLKVNNGEEAKFRFEIVDVYRGEKYDDTCLTGLLIEFSGRTGH